MAPGAPPCAWRARLELSKKRANRNTPSRDFKLRCIVFSPNVGLHCEITQVSSTTCSSERLPDKPGNLSPQRSPQGARPFAAYALDHEEQRWNDRHIP